MIEVEMLLHEIEDGHMEGPEGMKKSPFSSGEDVHEEEHEDVHEEEHEEEHEAIMFMIHTFGLINIGKTTGNEHSNHMAASDPDNSETYLSNAKAILTN